MKIIVVSSKMGSTEQKEVEIVIIPHSAGIDLIIDEVNYLLPKEIFTGILKDKE